MEKVFLKVRCLNQEMPLVKSLGVELFVPSEPAKNPFFRDSVALFSNKDAGHCSQSYHVRNFSLPIFSRSPDNGKIVKFRIHLREAGDEKSS